MALYAQDSLLEYRPFAEDGKVWESQVGGIKENVYRNRIEGDTLIGDDVWKKVYNYTFRLGGSYFAAIRDTGKKVYAIAKGSNRPRLLYDFGLKVGDKVRCGVEGNAFGCLLDAGEKPDNLLGFMFVTYLRVEHIDTIMVRGMLHRCFRLTMLDAFSYPFRGVEDGGVFGNIVWVEGVGSGAGPFSPWMPLPPPEWNFFLSCDIGQTHLFGYSDFHDYCSTKSIVRADVNGDGKVDVADIATIISVMVGKPTE